MNWYDLIDDPLAPYIENERWHANRRSTLRGSDATVLARGKPEDIRRLWREKTGRQKISKRTPTMAMLMGKSLEDLNWRMFARLTGRPVWGLQSDHVHQEHTWLGLSADAITVAGDGREAYLELKCVSALKDLLRLFDLHEKEFRRLIKCRAWEREIVYPELVREYYAQCQHACFVGGWEVAVLSAVIGNQHVAGEIEFDRDYWEELFFLEQDFWAAVKEDRKPDESLYRGVSFDRKKEDMEWI